MDKKKHIVRIICARIVCSKRNCLYGNTVAMNDVDITEIDERYARSINIKSMRYTFTGCPIRFIEIKL